MTEQQTTTVPSVEDFFGICLQMLAAAQSLHETTLRQAEEIRHLIAQIRARD